MTLQPFIAQSFSKLHHAPHMILHQVPYAGKFWQIATVETNGEENFGGSNGRFSVVSVSLISISREKFGKFALIAKILPL